MKKLAAVLLAVGFAGLVAPLLANEHPCRTGFVTGGTIEHGGSVTNFRIRDDTRLFRLDGLLKPGEALPLQADREVDLFASDIQPDRYGRVSVQMFSESGGEWVQGSLLRNGRVFQYALGVPTSCIKQMRKAEQSARRKRLGLWRKPPLFDAHATDDLLQHIGKFVIVTGIVKSVGDRERRLYLNFGSKWSEDTTVVLTKKGSGAYRGNVAVLQRLEGKRAEIRGILDEAQGPLIRLIDEAQIDISDR